MDSNRAKGEAQSLIDRASRRIQERFPDIKVHVREGRSIATLFSIQAIFTFARNPDAEDLVASIELWSDEQIRLLPERLLLEHPPFRKLVFLIEDSLGNDLLRIEEQDSATVEGRTEMDLDRFVDRVTEYLSGDLLDLFQHLEFARILNEE
ncbi:MAG: hypothetical protein ABR552_08085 [Actinomycetota bacterium]